MKKIIKSILLLFVFINLGLTINSVVYAFGDPCAVNPYMPACFIQSAGKNTGIPDFSTQFYTANQHPEAPSDPDHPGMEPLASPAYYALDIFRFAMSGIAMIVFIIAAIRLVASDGTDENLTKAKDTLVYSAIGLIIIQLASSIVKKMFFGDSGQAFATGEDGNPSETFAFNTASELRGIVGMIEYFLGAVALLVIIVRSYALIFGAGQEEAMTKAKKHIMYAVVGIIVIGLSEFIIRKFVFPNEGASLPAASAGRDLILQVTNFVAGFIAIVSFVMLFYAGYKYVVTGFSGQEADKIKKMLLGVVIGLVLSAGSYAIVNSLLSMDEVAINEGSGTETPINSEYPLKTLTN